MRVSRVLVTVVAILAMAQAAEAQSPPPSPSTAATPRAPSAPDVTVVNRAPDAPSAPSEPGAPSAPAAPSEQAVAPAPAAPSAPDQAAAPPAETNEPAPAANGETEKAEAPLPEPTLAIDIDLAKQTMHVSENGRSKYVWPVSSGARGNDTPTGTFTPVWMSKMWYSRQYDYAPMPNAIFFHGGAAIHGTAYVGSLGRPASHGCVRLAPGNAGTLYKLVSKHGKAATRIVVHGKPNHGAGPEVAYRRQDRRRYGYYEGDDRDRYDPPVYYQRRRYYTYDHPYYRARPRGGDGYYYPPQRRYTQRGLFNGF